MTVDASWRRPGHITSNYDMEHLPFDVSRLLEFMHGLVDGGPGPSGHRTPAVIVTLPVTGADEQELGVNSRMVNQVLAAAADEIGRRHIGRTVPW